MTAHELARRLLELPDLPVATHANNHTAPVNSTVNIEVKDDAFIMIGNFPDEAGRRSLAKIYADLAKERERRW